MTHYYLYIEAGARLDDTSKFYSVGIGSSLQGNRDRKFLEHYAALKGHYFAIWSDDVDEFLAKVKNSLSSHSVQTRMISARNLVRSFKTATMVPESAASLKTAHHQRYMMNLDYRISCNLAAG